MRSITTATPMLWRHLGASVPRSRGILVISAHWYVNVSAVTAMSHPKTIHDFYGFPDELFSLRYPAPGSLASAAGSTADVLVDGYTYGSLSMTSYTLDATWPERHHSRGAAAALPDPGLIPPDDTNT